MYTAVSGRRSLAEVAKSISCLHKDFMIDHVSVPVHNLANAVAFYDAVLAPLDMSRLVTREKTAGYGKSYPEFWVNVREDLLLMPNPGAHVALRAETEIAVQRFYKAALSNGGVDDGPPGPRQGETTAYVGAFVRDPDGNKIEVVTFPRQD